MKLSQLYLRKLPRWCRRPMNVFFVLIFLLFFVYWIIGRLFRERHLELILDSVCSPVTNTCFLVTDAEGRDGEFYRQLFIKEIKDDVESQVRLLKPDDDLRKHDTRLWDVDHSWLPAEYLAWMLAGTLMTDAMAFNDLASVGELHFLFIGLGGGALPSFVRLNLPKINITVVELDSVVMEMAEKWFEFRPDARLRCHVGDGIDYLRTEAVQGHKYDAVFLDACDGDRLAALSCPVHLFVNRKVIQDTYSVLKPMGVLTVNILTSDDDLVTHVAKEFRKVFPTVIAQTMQNEDNTVLICLPYSLASFNESQLIFKERFHRITTQLNLDIDYFV
uniref:Uncharacterized protein n=1 Tax=Plectus sambesii TaxID=2011161 RepID=A0A914WFM6_9BILA